VSMVVKNCVIPVNWPLPDPGRG